MEIFVLILTIHASRAAAIEHIPGFTNLAACEQVGKDWAARSYWAKEREWVCVRKGSTVK